MKGNLQLKNGNYYVVCYVMENGKRKQKWISTGLKMGTPEEKLNGVLNEILAKEELLKQNICKTTNIDFCSYYQYWLNMKKSQVELSTYENYYKYYGKIKQFFYDKNISLSETKSEHILQFYDFLRQNGICDNTIRHYHITINQVFEYAVKTGYLLFNPMKRVEKPRNNVTRNNFYDKQEMKKLFEIIENENIKTPVMLSAIYGLRRSEVLGLKWQAIDFDNKKIYIEHKVIQVTINNKTMLYKSNKLKTQSSTRELPLLPQAEAILLTAKEKCEMISKNNKNKSDKDFDYVCIDELGNLITPSRLTHAFAKIIKKNNLKHIRFHDLRHSCASIMLSENIPMKQIQEWLGHSNYSTTANIYSHLDFKTKLNSAKSVSNAYSFINKKYDIPEEKILNIENLSEEEIITKIKIYQRMLRSIRQKTKR